MEKEIKLTTATRLISTIYFGGGTPSLLSTEELATLLQAAKQFYKVDEGAEITLEANPDDINENTLRQWKALGINRLSIGVQSFKQPDLEWMNRAHSAIQALHSLELVKSAGFTNYSVDLIYGTPVLNDHEWRENIERVIALGVPHLSCYALTVEPSTALYKMIAKKKKEDVDPEKQARQFLILVNLLESAGYEHYEISNFALPGYRSKHNSSYWQGNYYTGIGPSAHSYYGDTRRWNLSNNALYIKSLQNNTLPYEEETLTETQRLNEYIMTSLRTIEGLDLEVIENGFGAEQSAELQLRSRKYEENLTIMKTGKKLTLTREGKLFADGIAADLFFDAE